MTALRFRHWLAVLALLGALGCMRDPSMVAWEARFATAERALAEGGHEQALAAYRALLPQALNASDRIETRQRIADTLLAMGRFDEAVAAYVAAAEDADDDEDRARLLFRAARAYYDRPETQEAGLALIIRVVDKFPSTVAGLRALQYVTEHFGGTDAGQDWLLRFYRDRFGPLSETPLADNLVFGAAEILAGRTDDDAREALRLLRELTAAYKRAQLWDDAMWLRADLEHRLGLYEEELGSVTAVVRTREKPMFFGNYETLYYHRGQYRIAELLRNELMRPDAAIAAFETFVREYPFSKYWDDALFQLTELYLESGRQSDAHRTADRLTKERPDSRYATRVQQLVKTGRDPGPAPLWTDPTRPHDYEGAER